MNPLESAKGLYVVAQTPFDDEGVVDLESVESLADFYVKHGADGFTVLGVAGESVKLTSDEAIQVVKRYLKRSQGRPVVVGISNSNTAQLRELTDKVMDLGAAGVMIAPPGGLNHEEELFNYFGTSSPGSATCRSYCRTSRPPPACGCRCPPSCGWWRLTRRSRC